MVDYSKFENIVDSDDERESESPLVELPPPSATGLNTPAPLPPPICMCSNLHNAFLWVLLVKQPQNQPTKEVLQAAAARAGLPPPTSLPVSKKGKEGRLRFEHEGRTIYEWEQSLDEVNIYITPPPGVKASMIDCKISHQHLTVGLKGNPPFLKEDLGGPVKVDESFWMMGGDGELNISLQKMVKAQTWAAALRGAKGQEMDPFTAESVKKKMMLERFQEENPGFDFSGAEFNGAVPDPESFMGGVRYT